MGTPASGGQSCVAPEYVLLPKGLVRPLADKLVAHLAEAHGEDPKCPRTLTGLQQPRVSHRRVGATADALCAEE